MRLFILVLFIFLTFGLLQAEERFVGYLKPYKSQETLKMGKKDPTAEPLRKFSILPKDVQSVSFDLKGILYHPTEKKAFINGELYGEGDLVEGYRVYRILKDKVIMLRDNKQIELNME